MRCQTKGLRGGVPLLHPGVGIGGEFGTWLYVGEMANQWSFEPDTYLSMVRSEISLYDDLQERLADATTDVSARTILDLGSGTGVTAQRVLARHPTATLVGLDMSPDMLTHAARAIPSGVFMEQALEDPLPTGPFDLVVSAFAVHHLPSLAKAELFQRVADVLRPGGRFALCDVVVPTTPVARPIPLEEGVDLPDSVADQRRWFEDAGLTASVVFESADMAILQGDRK